jgi:meso-butanediol dehydrogenase / (S,S)-butanediol dehydrogenase / diacetyl reductase
MKQHSQLVTLRPAQTPDDLAGLVSYLAGPGSDHVTGQAEVIDHRLGGIVMV